jgi:hypothetical protein
MKNYVRGGGGDVTRLFHANAKKKLYTVITLFAVCCFLSCDDNLSGSKSKTYSIKYEITGSASSVDITMSNAGGDTEQLSDVPLPWEKAFSVKVEEYSYYFAYISAQNQGNSGTVTVTIYRNGSVFKTATSSGAYVIATASGGVD